MPEINYQLQQQQKFLIIGVAESGLPYYKELAETNLLRAAVGNIGSGKDTGTALLNLVLDEYNRQGFKDTIIKYVISKNLRGQIPK